jgi:hypothetical protein
MAAASRGEHSAVPAPRVPAPVFEPLDFIARLATLVPKPRMHLTR